MYCFVSKLSFCYFQGEVLLKSPGLIIDNSNKFNNFAPSNVAFLDKLWNLFQCNLITHIYSVTWLSEILFF